MPEQKRCRLCQARFHSRFAEIPALICVCFIALLNIFQNTFAVYVKRGAPRLIICRKRIHRFSARRIFMRYLLSFRVSSIFPFILINETLLSPFVIPKSRSIPPLFSYTVNDAVNSSPLRRFSKSYFILVRPFFAIILAFGSCFLLAYDSCLTV